MKDNLILIVNEKGKLETAPIGLLKANANYTSTITVITPMPLDNVVMANFNKRNSVDWNVSQFLIPSGNKKGKDMLDITHDLYQKVYDWNVFEGNIDSKAVAYFAKYRADLLYVSIGIGSQQTPALAENYKGIFNHNKVLPETAENGDYYISNGYNFNDKNIKWTLNDIAYYWNGWKKSNYIGIANTTSVAVPVDPNIPTNIEVVADNDLAVLLAGKIATIEENIVNLDILTQEHKIRISNLESDNEINKTDIANLKLKDQEQDNRLNEIEKDISDINDDISNITESIKIDNDTLVRENEVIKVSDKLTNQIYLNKNDILNIRDTTYTKLDTDNKLKDKEDKINQFVKDVRYDRANNRLTFEFKVGNNLVVDITGGGVGGVGIEDIYLEENELVFVFTNEKVVRIPLGSLLVGIASEEWVEYRLNLYAKKADLELLEESVNVLETAVEETKTLTNDNKTEINSLKETTQTHTVEIGNINSEINTLKDTTQTHTNQIANVNSEIITLKTTTQEHTTEIENIGSEVSDLNETVGEHTTELGSVKTDISSIKTKNTQQDGRLSTNENDISSIKTKNAQQDTAISKNTNDIENIETELASVNTKVVKNTTDIQNIKDTTYTKTQSDGKFATIQAMDLQLQEKLNVKPDGTNPLVLGNKINSIYIDNLYITDVFVVSAKNDLTTLSAQRGDIAIVENENKTYVLKSGSPTVLTNWIELLFPVSVVSVNGKTGAVILGISDIPELESTLNSKLAVNVFENFKNEVYDKIEVDALLTPKITKAQGDTYYVPLTRTINGKALNTNITLNATDVGARARTWTPTYAEIGGTKPPVDADKTPNLKTINGQSIIGSGNITISTDVSNFAKLNETNTFTKPQVVPNAVNDNEVVNLGQVKGMTGGGEGQGLDLDKLPYMNEAASIYYKSKKNSLFKGAWEHSLEVDVAEIEKNSTTSTQYGRMQYPNGDTFGVIIPSGVTSIGGYAFYDWKTNNQPLVIPNSVTSIDEDAFAYWEKNNQPLAIPNSVSSIGQRAFAFWSSNNQPLLIPDSVSSIGGGAFGYWSSNNHPLVIPNGVVSIDEDVFAYWETNNQPLVIPDSVSSIGQRAFAYWYSNNHPLVIPNSVISIGAETFTEWSSNNQPLLIPDSVSSIGGGAFGYWSSNNQPLVIPNSVISIGAETFTEWSSNNHPLVIPNSVISIGEHAFSDWQLVPYIEIKAIIPPSLSNSNAFENQNNAPIYVPDESLDDYKTATNWVDLASRIKPISEKQ